MKTSCVEIYIRSTYDQFIIVPSFKVGTTRAGLIRLSLSICYLFVQNFFLTLPGFSFFCATSQLFRFYFLSVLNSCCYFLFIFFYRIVLCCCPRVMNVVCTHSHSFFWNLQIMRYFVLCLLTL